MTSGWARHDCSGFRGLGLNDREELHYEFLGRSFEYGFPMLVNGLSWLGEPYS